NNSSDHVHQFEMLSFHIASEQAFSIRSEFKKPAVKLGSKLSTDRPDRVERLSDELNLFRGHDDNRRNQKPKVTRSTSPAGGHTPPSAQRYSIPMFCPS